jgi:catechol 2,3-dioxygenase-like lactoylglutathione lyase family enzyme
MADVTELRVVLTVADFDEAIGFYRDSLGLEQLEDWSSEEGRVVLLDGGHATLELFDESQAEMVDAVEAGRRVSGTVRLALQVSDSEETARRLVASGAEQVAPPLTTPWGDRNARAHPARPASRRTRLVGRASSRGRRSGSGTPTAVHRRDRGVSVRLAVLAAPSLEVNSFHESTPPAGILHPRGVEGAARSSGSSGWAVPVLVEPSGRNR